MNMTAAHKERVTVVQTIAVLSAKWLVVDSTTTLSGCCGQSAGTATPCSLCVLTQRV